MGEESDYRELERDRAARTAHLDGMRAAVARRKASADIRREQLAEMREELAALETLVADDKRQLALDAEILPAMEAYARDPARARLVLSDKPFHRPAYHALRALHAKTDREHAAAGVRVDEAQRTGTDTVLAAAWADFVIAGDMLRDLTRLLAVIGPPLRLADSDTAYPADAPAAGSLPPHDTTEGTDL